MSFLSQLPNELTDLFKTFEDDGLTFVIVGGSVRDWINLKKVSKDLDFEFRSKNRSLNECKIIIAKHLQQKKIDFSALPYEILKIRFLDFDIELSPPRLEKSIKQKIGHHHFEAHFDLNMSFKDSFIRRDLTINAIGIDLNFHTKSESIVDPFLGVDDIKKKKLKHLSNDFFLDPVRLLRLVRFHTNWNFTLDEELKKNLKKFNCLELSKHYIKTETLKSYNTAAFLKLFIEIIEQYKIQINNELSFLKMIVVEPDDQSLEDLLISNYLAYQELIQSPFSQLIELFQIPQKKLKSLERYVSQISRLNSLDSDFWNELISSSLTKDLSAVKSDDLKSLKFLFDESLWQKKLPFNPFLKKVLLEYKTHNPDSKDDLSSYDKEIRSLVPLYLSLKKVSHV
jgi:tRNA nucleotidyltransferase/poly(A) polymerase